MTSLATQQPRILITGVCGFVGKHLSAQLQKRGIKQIWGTSRRAPGSDWPQGVEPVCVDLLESQHLKEHLNRIRPDQIYHLAGQASVARSWKEPVATYQSNIQGQLYLFEALGELKMAPRILSTCSSDEYGAVDPSELPVSETHALRPLSPYAISKVAQDLMGYQYYKSTGLPVVRTRAFNHTGPGRPDSYAVSGFASQIARMEKGLQPPTLSVGNLSVHRDYLDVRDVVDAYILCMEKGLAGEVYNICSGRAHSLKEIVDMLLAQSAVRVTIVQDPARMRPADFPVVYGDPRKLISLTGWKPAIPLEQTLRDLLDYWRHHWDAAPQHQEERVPL